MEVVWTRAFAPVLSTTIYAFAALLTTYLFATWIGSCFYRRHLRKGHAWTTAKLLACLAVFSFLPIALNDPRLSSSRLVVLLSIIPICAALGYLTPKLIDQYSLGSPRSAGRGYALNILGCIIGPLLAGYGLLPWLGARFSMVLLATPFLLFYARHLVSNREAKYAGLGVLSLALLLVSVFVNVTYEDGGLFPNKVVRRDYAATIISCGEGMNKGLLVNGIQITSLTPITKLMAHLPLAFRSTRPQSALDICFGMGTTFRSLMSWDIEVTAVELVPSVKEAFGYYFGDAPTLLRNPKSRIIIDDGRRFLNRTAQKFDVITIDPPPPVETAGSSLLYSQEFYELVKQHLTSNGILQQWFPGGEEKILVAVINSLTKVFPYVKMYRSIEGRGVHFLAATQPFQTPSSEEMIARMPAAARTDLMEWFHGHDLKTVVNAALSHQIGLDKSALQSDNILISDDRPFNEYFFLRRQRDRLTGSHRYLN
jgi:spermidine synthase